MKKFGGKILFLDRSDINTDEIIPAKYLTETSRAAMRPHCLEDLKLAGFDPKTDLAGKGAVVTRANFGCGSSREHAPWALEENGIDVVVGQSFARIFRQNTFNCGMLAIELPEKSIAEIFDRFAKGEADLTVSLDRMSVEIQGSGQTARYPFQVAPFDLALVKAGGWVDYADAHY